MKDAIKKRDVGPLNKQAIKCLFDDEENFKQAIEDTLYKTWETFDLNLDEDDVDENISFEEFIDQFVYEFQTIGAEHVAHTVLNVDTGTYYDYHNRQMDPGDVQAMIDGEIELNRSWLRVEPNEQDKQTDE